MAPSAAARILLVDDEAAILKLLTTILTRAEFQVKTAVTPADAIDALGHDFFDLVITDAIMPTTSGYDFVRTVRQHPLFGQVPILMLTKKRNREDVKKAVEVGVTDYILKPIDEHLLLEKVQQCMKKGGGKRELFELSLIGENHMAQVTSQAQLVSIGEGGLTALLPYKIGGLETVELKARIFDEIGIERPLFRVLSAQPVEGDSKTYETRFSFMGVPEEDLRKIRAWIQKELIRRRK
ncbi:MAG: response regulator [Bdellovibrionales bacterium]|nr:response regulator [Bdellovibrionales bacterium]